MGRLEAIWTKRMSGGPMDPHDEARAVEDHGLEDCAGAGHGWRQVTVIEKEVFDQIRKELPDAEPYMRRANFMVSGVRLKECRDRILKIGDLRIHMRGETRPCHQMDEECHGLQDALDPEWKARAFGRVLNDAVVRALPFSQSLQVGEIFRTAGRPLRSDESGAPQEWHLTAPQRPVDTVPPGLLERIDPAQGGAQIDAVRRKAELHNHRVCSDDEEPSIFVQEGGDDVEPVVGHERRTTFTGISERA